jgi:hypothetical protein
VLRAKLITLTALTMLCNMHVKAQPISAQIFGAPHYWCGLEYSDPKFGGNVFTRTQFNLNLFNNKNEGVVVIDTFKSERLTHVSQASTNRSIFYPEIQKLVSYNSIGTVTFTRILRMSPDRKILALDGTVLSACDEKPAAMLKIDSYNFNKTM